MHVCTDMHGWCTPTWLRSYHQNTVCYTRSDCCTVLVHVLIVRRRPVSNTLLLYTLTLSLSYSLYIYTYVHTYVCYRSSLTINDTQNKNKNTPQPLGNISCKRASHRLHQTYTRTCTCDNGCYFKILYLM